jgi:hypothetical protein
MMRVFLLATVLLKYVAFSALAMLTFPAIADDGRAEDSAEGQSELDRRASSYLYAQAVNAEALTSFDVLIRYEAFHDIGPGRSIRDETLLRLRVDFTAKKLLAIRRIERRQMDTGISNEEVHKTIFLGASATQDQTTETLLDGKLKHNAIGMPAAMAELELVDVRYIGFSSYPTIASSQSTFAQLVAESKVVQGFQVTPVSGNRLKLSRESPIGNSVNDTSYNEWTFDTTTLTPTTFYDEIRRDVDGKRVHYPKCRENIEWQDASGVYVPLRIIGMEVKTVPKDGKPMRYEIDKTVQFHWFSVNSKLEDDDFSAKLIETYDTAFPLIDEDLFDSESIFQSEK